MQQIFMHASHYQLNCCISKTPFFIHQEYRKELWTKTPSLRFKFSMWLSLNNWSKEGHHPSGCLVWRGSASNKVWWELNSS